MNRQTLRRIAIPVAAVLCIAAVMWPQVRSVATILLLLVTFEYVLLTQESIELFRRQLLRQEKVYVNFELLYENGLFIRVANLGVSNFLMAAIHVRTQDIAKFDYPTREVVESGKIIEMNLPAEICAGNPMGVDLEITLECVGLDVRADTKPRLFNVMTDENGVPQDVKRGFGGLWSITCPRCKKNFGGLVAMSLHGLKTFDEAFARKRQVLEDFHNSCPNHDSEFQLKMDGVPTLDRIPVPVPH